VYAISDAGRQALREWLDTPGRGPVLEFEALVQVAFGDQGSREQLLRTLRSIREQAEAHRAQAREQASGYAPSGGPFPDRLPVIALTGKLLLEQAELLGRWAAWAEHEVETWSGVTPTTGAQVPSHAFTPGWLA
jgi:hypothetical protein